MMERWVKKVAIVTGASSGIGAQITSILVKNGMRVIAVARRLEKLEELKKSIKSDNVHIMHCDVRKEQDILKVFIYAEETFGGVDVLINNAGVIFKETIIDGLTETYREIMDVNVIAPAICSRELVQSVKKRKVSGHIININSTAGYNAEHITVPVSLYCASKHALTGMAVTLRNELINAQIDVKITNVSPGIVKTPLTVQTYDLSSAIADGLCPILEDVDIAEVVLYILSTPSHVQISEVILKVHEAAYKLKNVKQ